MCKCHLTGAIEFCGLYYEHLMIVNYATSIINNLGTSLTDDARVVISDHHMFIVQAAGIGENSNEKVL